MLKLLTTGVSPFYFTRNARIHDNIIKNISDVADCKIGLSSVFLDHDSEYFPQERIEDRYIGIDGKFYSTYSFGDQLVTNIFDVVEEESPDVVLSIGPFSDLEHIRAIKRILPDSFNWVIILTSNIDKRFSEFSDTLREADHVVCLTEQSNTALTSHDIGCSFLEYGVDDEYLQVTDRGSNRKLNSCPTFIVNDKNIQQSNIALILDSFLSFRDEEFKVILHTNYYEQGDYDLDCLISKFKIGQIEVPGDFVSIKEGISVADMIKLYQRAHFVIDLSIKPVTSLCSLEAMACGCVPIVNSSGFLYEKLARGKDCLSLRGLSVDNNVFFGEYMETFCMASQSSFLNKLKEAFKMVMDQNEKYDSLSKLSRSISTYSSSKGFCKNISNLIVDSSNLEDTKELKLKIETL